MSLSLKGVFQHSVTAHNTQSILKQDKKEYNNNTVYTTGSRVQTLANTLQSTIQLMPTQFTSSFAHIRRTDWGHVYQINYNSNATTRVYQPIIV